MAAESQGALDAGRSHRDLPSLRPELILIIATILCLALIPVHILEAYGGLPAHPLLLHVPVITIPVVVLWALLLVARPSLVTRHGLAAATLAVIALAGTVLTVGAGEALRNALHLGANTAAGPGSLIARHAHAADILRLLMFVFVLVLIVYVLAQRVASGRTLGRTTLDRGLSLPLTRRALAVAVAALAIACGYFVFHTGDLGAKAVWANRLHGHGSGFPSGAPEGTGGAGQQQELFGGSQGSPADG